MIADKTIVLTDAPGEWVHFPRCQIRVDDHPASAQVIIREFLPARNDAGSKSIVEPQNGRDKCDMGIR
jgi:hypothetical protein